MNKLKTAVLFGAAFYAVVVIYMIIAVFVGDVYFIERSQSNWSQARLFWWWVTLWMFFTPIVAGLFVSLSNKAGKIPSNVASITSGCLIACVWATISGGVEYLYPGNQFFVVLGFLPVFLLAAYSAGWNIGEG